MVTYDELIGMKVKRIYDKGYTAIILESPSGEQVALNLWDEQEISISSDIPTD